MRKITTYSELKKYINAFGDKKLNLLFIVSRGGLGKTTIAEECLLEKDPLMFKGHVTPLQMYKSLYLKNEEEKDYLVMFDDVESLLTNKTNVAMLKQICETKKDKLVQYDSTSHLLKGFNQHFETSCKVLVLLNETEAFANSISLKALLTRAHIILFEPTPGEILQKMMTYAKDKVIVNFIKRYSNFSEELNLRTYERAKELKNSSLHWQEEIINSLSINENLFEIDELMTKYSNDKDRIENFSGSRITYYRYKKKFLEKIKK